MDRPSPFALYYAFLASIVIAIIVAPNFSPMLERMNAITYGAVGGAVAFIFVTVYQGITAKLGVAPFRPAKWVLWLFRVSDDVPPSDRLIRIIATPPGDAPLWVREKWVGLMLPIIGSTCRRACTVSVNEKATFRHNVTAVLSGRAKTVTGYHVNAGRAVDILDASNPEAAKWWRQNTPHLLRAGRHLIFNAKACELSGH